MEAVDDPEMQVEVAAVSNEVIVLAAADDKAPLNDFVYDADAAANVSSAIMFKLPTKALPALRRAFETGNDSSLNLIQFLEAFVRNMDLDESLDALLSTIPDLLDFFKSVDINGDGRMEWSEFVAFVIESVVTSDPPVIEEFVNVARHAVQAVGQRQTVRTSKFMPDFNRLFVGIGAQIVIYEADDKSDTWLGKGVRVNLVQREPGVTQSATPGGGEAEGAASSLAKSSSSSSSPAADAEGKGGKKKTEGGPRARKDDRMQNALSVLDFVYLVGREMLIVLRSDLCLEFHKFMTRGKVHADMILQNGLWPLAQPYNKLALRETRTTPWRLFAIGENRKVVDSWLVTVNMSGAVELSDYQPLKRHTDFLRDVLVIHNDHYDLLVTCGMDKVVFLWDLTTLQYKATRSGHAGGVQCVAFDGKSLLLAGGFDFRIIAWDLDAEIDRPLFQLWGHQATVTKIVAIGNISRAFSLDAKGRLRLWDTSKSNPNDKEARQIDEVSFTEDTFRCIDVLRNVSTNFPSAHRVIVNVQGRRNHVYKLVDMAPMESAPIPAGVLFSSSLLMFITVHAKDVLFFSAVTGSEQNKLDRDALGLEVVQGNELQVAVLDDRERKLILGDQTGRIDVYNCLSGVRLKTLATHVPFACRFMLYTPEKLLVAVAGPGELYVFDELPNFPTADTTLRDTRAHDSDVVALAYSFELGLIATADCTGTVSVWSFEFMALEATIPDCTGTGSDIGQIAFLGKFPLLLVTDSHNNFCIVPVGPAMQKFGKTIWRVESEVWVNPALRCSRASDRSVLDLDAEAKIALFEREAAACDDEEEGATPSAASGEEDEEEEEEEEEEDGGKAPITKKRHVNEYLRRRRDCKSMTILVQKSDKLTNQEAVEAAQRDPNTAGRDLDSPESRLDALLGSCNPNRLALAKKDEVDEAEDEAFWAAINGTKTYDPDEDKKEKAPQGAAVVSKKREKKNPAAALLPSSLSVGFPGEGVRVFALCGFDDGSVTVTDLTPALESIGVGELHDHESASKQAGYDPRRTSFHKANDHTRPATLWTAEEVSAREKYTTARLSLLWMAHAAAVTTVQLVCDGDVLTAGADMGVCLWSLDGRAKGVLTRGREWDRIFPPQWLTPVDLERRERKRRGDARLLVDFLGLQAMMKKRKVRRPGEKERDLIFGEAESAVGGEGGEQLDASVGGSSKGVLRHAFGPDEAALHPHLTQQQHQHQQDKNHNHKEAKPATVLQLQAQGDAASVSVLSAGDAGHDFEDDPDRVRVVGQLRGKVTYHQSAKDAAHDAMMIKQQAAITALQNIGKKKKKIRRIRTGGGFGGDWATIVEEEALGARPKVVKSTAARYLDDLMSAASSDSTTLSPAQLSQAAEQAAGAKARKIKSKYDVELAQLDADDPNNWEIHSSNRQRALYQRLFLEMDKKGYTKDPLALFEAKLNALSPGGNFRAYLEVLEQEKGVGLGRGGLARDGQGHGQGQEGAGMLPSGPGEAFESQSLSLSLSATGKDGGGSGVPAGAALPSPLDPFSPSASHLSLPGQLLRPPAPTLHPPPSPPSLAALGGCVLLPALGSGAAAALHAAEAEEEAKAAKLHLRQLKLKQQMQGQGQGQSPTKSKQKVHSASPSGAGEAPLAAVAVAAVAGASSDRPPRLTPAQLAAATERQAVLDIDAKFESSLRAVDALAKAATARVRRAKGEYRRLAKSRSDSALPPLGSPLSPSSHGGGVVAASTHAPLAPPPSSPSPSSSISLGSIDPFALAHPMAALMATMNLPASSSSASASGSTSGSVQSGMGMGMGMGIAGGGGLMSAPLPAEHPASAPALPNTRHTTASLLLDRQASIDGVMEVTRKKKAAEQSWMRKARSLLSPSVEHSSRRTKAGAGAGTRGSKPGAGVDGRLSISASSTATASTSASETARRQQQRDKKIASRESFGAYQTKDLLGLLKAFQSLPQVYVPAPSPSSGVVEGAGVGESKARDQDEDEDEEGWGDDEEEEFLLPAEAEAEVEFLLASAAAANLDPEAAAAAMKQAEEARAEAAARAAEEAEAAEQARREHLEAEADARYSDQVLCSSIKIQPLLQHPFLRIRPAMRASIEKFIQSQSCDGTSPSFVLCALRDLPGAACPMMRPDDRLQLLRLFVMNTPSQDVSEAADRGVTVQQLHKLKEMFRFFDKDGSGGIDKEEILEVLVRLRANTGESGEGQGGAEELIQGVKGNADAELSFDDFARLFRRLVQE